MNKHTKNRSLSSLAERLRTPGSLMLMGSILAGYALGLFSTGMAMPESRNKKPKEDQRIEQLNSEDRRYFEFFKKNFHIGNVYVTTQDGQNTEVKELMKRSVNGKAARKYAKDLVEAVRIFTPKREYETLDSKVSLATEVMDTARTVLQRAIHGGRGFYTRDYEVGEQHDSKQTFDEFRGPKEDGREFAGDCDDYSTALTTVYHTVKSYAEKNKTKDPFLKSLAEGLEHYKIVSAHVSNHALNLELTMYNKLMLIHAIEPQAFESKPTVILEDNGLFIKYKNEEGDEVISKAKTIFGKDFSATAK